MYRKGRGRGRGGRGTHTYHYSVTIRWVLRSDEQRCESCCNVSFIVEGIYSVHKIITSFAKMCEVHQVRTWVWLLTAKKKIDKKVVGRFKDNINRKRGEVSERERERERLTNLWKEGWVDRYTYRQTETRRDTKKGRGKESNPLIP